MAKKPPIGVRPRAAPKAPTGTTIGDQVKAMAKEVKVGQQVKSMAQTLAGQGNMARTRNRRRGPYNG